MNTDSESHDREIPSRRDRKREKHRAEILDAAERVFVRDGVQVRIETIAHEAEYSVGAIYNFFENKDDLFKSVLLRISQSRIGEMDRILSQESTDEWNSLWMVAACWIDHHLSHGDFLHLAMVSSRNSRGFLPDADPAETALRRNAKLYEEKMLSYFSSFSNSPGVKSISSEVLFRVFESYLRSLLFGAKRRGICDRNKILEDAMDAFVQLFKKDGGNGGE